MIKVQFGSKNYSSLNPYEDIGLVAFLGVYLAFVIAMCYISLDKDLKTLKHKKTKYFSILFVLFQL